MAKKQRKTPVQKRTGTVALLSLFCAAAGVYAESDGWSYNDVEKSVIHAGGSHARIAPVKKGEELEDQSKIGNIKKAEISDNASFRYDPALGKDELKGVVYDNESGVHESASLKMSEGASLDVDATKSRDGKTDWLGKSAVGVEFAKDTTATIEAKDASIFVKGDTGATAISASDASTKLGNVEIGAVSAKATDSAKAFAINANDADSVKIGSVSGNIKLADAGTVDLGSMQGNIEAANVKDSISVEKMTGNITATSAKNVGIGEISGDVKIDTIGNSVNIDSLDGNLASTNVGDSSSESSVANITVKSASNTAREVNIDNLAATATISGDEENAEAAKVNVGTAEKKLSVNGKVEARVNEAKGGLSAELKNADANALYVKSVKGGAEIAGEGNVNIVNAEASETPAIKIGDLKGNFAAGVDSSAATSGAIKGDVEIGSISANTGIINLDGNLTAGTLGADETSTTLIGVSGADKTVDITTANGTTTVNGNGSLEAKVGTSNGILTVNDYKKATIGEVKDGSKLVLNGSDKDAIADVTKADKVEANALGKTTIDSANYVKASDSIDASLSIKGQNVKITDASGEYVVDTKALANEGTVEINKGSIANSIDGFNGNVKANETGTIKVEGAGMTGGLDIGKINGDLTSAENAKISGNVNVGEVNKVDVKGGIAAIDGKENTGNLTIGTANDNVAVSGGVAGNMKVADAKKDVAVDTVGKNLTIDMLNGGTVKADEVTETVKVSAGTGSIEVAKAGNVDAATTDGKLTIDGQKVSTNGSLSIKGTEVAEGGQIHVGAIDDIYSTVKGFKGDLTVDSNTGKIDVSTIDGILTVNDAQKDVNVSESAKAVNATLNGGDLNVSNAESNATVENVAVSGTGNVVIDNNTGSVDVGALGGKLTAKNAKGDINVATSATEIEATLNGGNINAENATVGSAKIGTAEGAQGNAVIGANTGSIDLVGTFNGKLTANNAQGDINVAEKATEVEAALNGGNIKGNEIGTITVKDNVDGSSSLGGIDVNKVDTIKLDGNLNGDIFVNEEVNKIDAESKKVTGDLILEKIASSANVGTVEGDINVSTLDKDAQLNVDTVLENTALGSTGKISVSDTQGNINVSNSVNEVDVVLNGGNLNVTNEAGTAEVVNNAVVSGTGNATIDKAKTIELGGDLKGNITVNTSVDTINGGAAGIGKTVDGNVDVEQNTGSITLGNVTGELKLGDAQGNVDVFQKAGNVDAMLNGGQLRVSQVDEDGTAKVDGQGKAIIGKASSIEANTSNGNFHLDGNNLQIEGGTLDVDVANVSKKEDGTVAEVKATGALDSVEIKNVNDGTNVSFNDVTKANGGTGNVDITDSKLGTVSASGTVEGDFNVTNVEGNIASTGEIQGTTNIADFKGDASFNTVKDVNVNSSDPDNKKGLDGSLTIAQGQGAVTFNADAGTVDINLDGGSVTTGLKPNGDAVVLDKANFSGNGTVNVTVDKLESFDQINDSVEINRKKLTSGGKLNSQITVNSGEFTITNADSITVDGHNENGGRKLAIENKITDDVTIGRIGKDGVAVAAENATIGGNLDIGTADGSVTVGTVNGKTEIDIANGDVTVTKGENVTIENAKGDVKLGLGDGNSVDNVTIGDIAEGKFATIGTAGDIDINGKGSLKVDTKAGDITVSKRLGGIDAANATVGNVNAGNATIDGDVNVKKAKNVKIDTVEGLVKVDNVGRVEIASVGGQTTIGTATDDVSIKTANDLVKVDNGTNVSVVNGKDVTVGEISGALKVDEGNAIKVDTKAGSLDLGTVASVNAGEIINNVDIDNVGRVEIASVGGQTTIGAATDNVKLGTAKNVTIGDIAEGKVATIGTAGDIDINGKGSLKVENEANNITAGNIKQVSVKTANGDIKIITADDLTFTTVEGNVNVSSEIKTVNGGNVNDDVSIAKNTGNVELLGTVNNLVLSNVAGGSSVVNKVKNKAEITTTAGSATIKESKQLQGTVDGGALTANTVSDIANITVNSGTANVGSAKSLDATVNGGSLNVDSVASSSNATVKANGGKSIFKTIAGKLKALLNGGEVEVAKNTGNVEISGSGDATVKDSTGSLEVATSTADKFVKNTNGGISTKGNLNVAIDKATSANFGTVNGGDIVDMTKIDNLTVSESTGILNVGLEGGQVKGNIVIEKATADVNVGNVANLDVTLRNNANLLAIDNTKVDAARVNGGCDASYYNVGTLKVDRSLDGNLEVRGAVSNSADINNVSGTVAINEVASTATASVKNAGSAIVDKANGNVEFFDFASGSATVNNATAKIEATNIAGGLNIGNVKDVKVNNTNVNVLDGNTVNGKIESTSDMTLSNSGTATIGNSGQIVVNGDLNVASEFKFAESTRNGAVIKANNLSGSGATKTVDNFFDAKFGFSGDDSVMEAAALKGTHNAGSSYIDANIDDMSVSHTYVDVTYKNTDGSSKVGYEITKNSYLSDKFAKSDNEKALAEIYDNLVFQDDATKDGESVQKKKNFKALAENGNIGAMLPQAVNHAARMNMDLSNMIHLDTINRTAYTRDMLNRINYLKAKGKLRGRHSDVLSGASSVTVRNINRFASYSGDGNIAGSNDSVYGGLANAEYVFDDSLFAGIGIGGFQAKSNGKDASGKAETQSFALNAYADYLFYDNFDWYFGLTYAYGMNEAERNSGSSMNKGKWNSNLVGAFTGVRYAWKPIADREFYIKPLLGMNVSFLMNPSFTENGDSERLDVDSEDYTSVKSIAGIEASYLLDCGLSVAGRMFYAHEFADNRYDITSSFIGSGYSVNTFRTLGSEIKRDTGIFGIGLGYDINTDWRVYLDYAAEVADDVYHNLNAGVQFKF